MQPRDDVLAILNREGRHAVDSQINTGVRAIQLSDAQQIGFQVKSIQLRAQVVAQKANTQRVLLTESLRAKLLKLIEALLQMCPPLLASLLRKIRPPVVVLVTPNRGSKFGIIAETLFEVLGKEFGEVGGRSLRCCQRPEQADRDERNGNRQQMGLREFDHSFRILYWPVFSVVRGFTSAI